MARRVRRRERLICGQDQREVSRIPGRSSRTILQNERSLQVYLGSNTHSSHRIGKLGTRKAAIAVHSAGQGYALPVFSCHPRPLPQRQHRASNGSSPPQSTGRVHSTQSDPGPQGRHAMSSVARQPCNRYVANKRKPLPHRRFQAPDVAPSFAFSAAFD